LSVPSVLAYSQRVAKTTEQQPGRTPLPLRLARGARTGLHVVQGLATTAFVFPLIGTARRRALIRRWSAQLLQILRVDSRPAGLPDRGLPGNLLIVANHVSWLDIFVLHAVRPSRFIAKAELKRWPLLGRLIAGCGTLFLERGSRRDAHRVNREARDVLAGGDTIAIFPEGTTTDGRGVLPFKSSLLQPIVDARGHVQPIALRYVGPRGAYNDAPVYIGETSFIASLWRVLSERRLIVELQFGPTLSTHSRHRRELSREAEAFIRAALERPPRDSAPETRDRRRA
jgi:1-acyl-sn-glycerol-3-phosphate acyltransferase